MAVSLTHLRAFWAVANARSFTRASKQLGVAQATISQHISRLEDELGTQVLRRHGGTIDITDAGRFLMRRVERILSDYDEALDGIGQFTAGTRGMLKVGILSSVARNLLPEAMRNFAVSFPNVEIDVLEVPPAETIDLLYARRISVGVVASDSIASSNLPFAQTELFVDPYVLAVPKGLGLEAVQDPVEDVEPAAAKVLNRTIRFEYGNQHKRRIDEWYKGVLPKARAEATTRTYEVALSMVQAGLGVAVVPALAAEIGPGHGFRVDLYRTQLADRRMAAMVPDQYLRIDPHRTFIAALAAAGRALELPAILEAPFLGRRSRRRRQSAA
ncbi:MAG: LysR family transcriptional regulator [Alphaproteobacteria bacterium]|nr:LysR family transcriptional regulator [Alphaproteobacteria bacterium]